MSYKEENGQVILAMSRDDYEVLIHRLRVAACCAAMWEGQVAMSPERLKRELEFLNRLNEGI